MQFALEAAILVYFLSQNLVNFIKKITREFWVCSRVDVQFRQPTDTGTSRHYPNRLSNSRWGSSSGQSWSGTLLWHLCEFHVNCMWSWVCHVHAACSSPHRFHTEVTPTAIEPHMPWHPPSTAETTFKLRIEAQTQPIWERHAHCRWHRRPDSSEASMREGES